MSKSINIKSNSMAFKLIFSSANWESSDIFVIKLSAMISLIILPVSVLNK